MNLRDLEYVTAIDRYHSFGKAAESCHVSQPALSAQVKKLEERLGVELFARTNSGVLTTDAGVRIVATAKDVLYSAQRIADTAAEYHDPFAAPLRIGMIPTIAPFIVPYMSSSIESLSDKLIKIYREQPTEKLLDELEQRIIDVALVSGPIEVAGYKFSRVFREPLFLVVSANHALANNHSISVDQIPVEQLLLLTEEHCLRADTLSLCGDKNIGIDIPRQTLASNLLTVSHYLAESVGCALMPALARTSLENANPNIRFIEIQDQSFARNVGFLSRVGCPREHILMALCGQIRSFPPTGVTSLN